MKHLLNFEPTVKFRKGSSFMFQTIVCLLYAIPLFMAAALAFDYLELESIIEFLNVASKRVEDRQVEFNKKQLELRADVEELKTDEKRLITYYRSLTGVSFSWTSLFGMLERTVPAGVRLGRIRIKPESVVQIFMEGEAKNLDEVTEFLRRLYSLERFSRPHLSRHAREDTPAGPIIRFTLDVQYLPAWEARP